MAADQATIVDYQQAMMAMHSKSDARRILTQCLN
jgi:hypothetical protein